ncbi:MAG: PH domain-containing protein [Verrucomicrobiota bacterium]
METKTEQYPGKVDVWLVAVVVVILLAVLISAGIVSWKTGDYRGLIFVLVCEVVTTSLILLISCPLRYQLDSEKIVVQSGVMRTEVPVDKITGIEKNRNPLSAPAWSLDRLKIHYDNDSYPAYIVVSPRDRERFLKQLDAYRNSSSAESGIS